MMGITYNTYAFYCQLKGKKTPTVDELKNISDVEWTDILKTLYWDKWKADEILNQSVANILADFFFNSGNWGIKIPQELLNVTVDGIVGKGTINRLNTINQKEFFYAVKNARTDFFNGIVARNPSQKVFLNGWMNRINSFTFSD